MSSVAARLIVNPAAGGGDWIRRDQPTWRLERVLDKLQGNGFEVELEPTEAHGQATELARAAVAQEDIKVVFVLGGDGTLREVAAGLLGSDTAFAPLPGGTTNVLCRSLGWPASALDLSERFHTRDGRMTVRPLDVGTVAGQPFLMMVSRGLDARALLNVPKQRKRRWGKSGIVLQSAIELLKSADPVFDYVADGDSQRASFAAICNIAQYAGPYVMAPGASPHDGRLHLVSLQADGRLAMASFVFSVWRRRHTRRPDVTHSQIEELTFPGSGRALLQIDGDPIEVDLPVEVTLHEQKLALLWPHLEA